MSLSMKKDDGRPRKFYVNGKQVQVLAERVEYLDESGKLVTDSLRDYSKKALRNRYASLNEFLQQWKAAERKQAVVEELEKEGLFLEPLAEDVGKDLDPFDLICHVAFDQPPLTRRDRAENVRKRDIFTRYGPQARAVLNALLQKYQDQGPRRPWRYSRAEIPPLASMGTPVELVKSFGGRKEFSQAVHELQSALYA